jgi:hypothetical protein
MSKTSSPGSPGDAARRERLRAALRENLKRRKAQAKARAGQGRSDGDAGPAPGAPRSDAARPDEE